MPSLSSASEQPLPSGAVTFLFTDIEESTRLWDRHPRAMGLLLARHDTLLHETIGSHKGVVFKTIGDAFCAVFADSSSALQAGVQMQRQLLDLRIEDEPDLALRVRIALHSGVAEQRDNDYFGSPLNRVARLLAVAHGGQILLSASVQAHVADTLPPGGTLRDMGYHRLKDLQQPEHVWQFVHPDLPAEFPPLRSLRDGGHNLPVHMTTFIGREEAISGIRQRLPSTRLLTLTGPGGIGKTRLALQVAAEALHEYRDGVWLVEMAPLAREDGRLAPQAVANVLGIREVPHAPLRQTLAETLRTKQMLLVWDNCEHLVDACAELAQSLLSAAPELRILVTSREPLQITGETQWPISSLPLPDSRRMPPLEALTHFDAIQLWVERAQAVRPDFILTEQNAALILNICKRLDGLPLAIELAASKVNMLTAEEIDTRLFQLLKGGSRTAPNRHKTLQSLIDWSYDLIEAPRAQILFCRFAVFTGGWTLDAAEAICADEGIPEAEIYDLLSRLVETSLVVREEQQGGSRYRLLETMRQYAADRLAKLPDTSALMDRFLAYYCDFAEQAGVHLLGPAQTDYLRRLETEQGNLRMAQSLAVSDNDLRLRLAGALWRYWQFRSPTEGIVRLQSALMSPLQRGVSSYARARALCGLGMLLRCQGENAAAEQALAESLELCRELQNAHGIAEAHSILGIVARDRGDYAAARSHHEQSLEYWRAVEDRWRIAAILNNLAMVSRDVGDPAAARALYEESLEIYRQLGDAVQSASVSNNVALLALDQQDYAVAAPLFRTVLEYFTGIDSPAGIAITLHNLGVAVHQLEGPRAAFPLFRESLILKRELNNRVGIAVTLLCLAEVGRDEGDHSYAASLFGAAEAILTACDSPLSPEDRRATETMMAPVRLALGEAGFLAVRDTGNRLAWDAAVAYAIEHKFVDTP